MSIYADYLEISQIPLILKRKVIYFIDLSRENRADFLGVGRGLLVSFRCRNWITVIISFPNLRLWKLAARPYDFGNRNRGSFHLGVGRFNKTSLPEFAKLRYKNNFSPADFP